MDIEGPNGLKAQECRGDFWNKLERAMAQARGGISIERLKEEKLEDVVNVLAQNGIRMVFNEAWHIDNIGR